MKNEIGTLKWLLLSVISSSLTVFMRHYVLETYSSFLKCIKGNPLRQGCTTQTSWRAKNLLLTHLRARLVKFFLFYIVFTTKIKPNIHKLEL